MSNNCCDINIDGSTNFNVTLEESNINNSTITGGSSQGTSIATDCNGDKIITGESTKLATCKNLNDGLSKKQDALKDSNDGFLAGGTKVATSDELEKLQKDLNNTNLSVEKKQDTLKDSLNNDLSGGTKVATSDELEKLQKELDATNTILEKKQDSLKDSLNNDLSGGTKVATSNELDKLQKELDTTNTTVEKKQDVLKDSKGGILQINSAIYQTNEVDNLVKGLSDQVNDLVEHSSLCLSDCEGNPVTRSTPVVTCSYYKKDQETVLKDLKSCSGETITNKTPIATCSDLNAAISGISAPNLVDCKGAKITSGASIATCSDLNAAITDLETKVESDIKKIAGEVPSFVDCKGTTITSGSSLATCKDLKDGLDSAITVASTPPTPTNESSLSTVVLGKNSITLTSSDVFLKVVIDNKTYLIPAYPI